MGKTKAAPEAIWLVPKVGIEPTLPKEHDFESWEID